MAAQGVLRALLNPSPLKEHWKTSMRKAGEQLFPGWAVENIIGDIETRFYGMSDARRDLGIDERKEPRS